MLRFKRYLFALIAICVIMLPIGIFTIADDTPGPITIKTSYGRTFTITNRDRASDEWTIHENYLDDANDSMSDLIYEKDVIKKGVDSNRSGLRALRDSSSSVVIPIIGGKRPDLAALAVVAKKILDLLDKGKDFEIYLDFVDKWADIEAKNQDIANKYSDRDKFHTALTAFEGFERPKQETGELSSMQQSIPPIGVRCGGACNAWWYNGSNWFLDGDTYPAIDSVTGVIGTSASLKDMRALAMGHQKNCNGCSDNYWSCNMIQDKRHEVLYCGKSIEYYMYDSLSGNWGYISVGTCGDSYRGCDDPTKKISHRYSAVMQGGTDSYGNWGYYVSSYNGLSATAHGNGSSTALSVSINGPNGVGVSENRIDKTPNCSVCMDGSDFCPNASSSHSNNNGDEGSTTTTMPDTTTYDNTEDCSYCTDGCSACPSEESDADDDSGDTGDTVDDTLYNCGRCGRDFRNSDPNAAVHSSNLFWHCSRCGQSHAPCQTPELCSEGDGLPCEP